MAYMSQLQGLLKILLPKIVCPFSSDRKQDIMLKQLQEHKHAEQALFHE